MTSVRLLAIGGAHIDRLGHVAGEYIPASSNPGTMREDVGGGVFNAARVAVRRGLDVTLFSLRGGDAGGEAVAAAARAAGIADLSVCFLDRATPSYTALIDRDGELIAAIADMGLYDAFAKQVARRAVRDAVFAADGLLTDANLPSIALERLAQTARGKPVFAIGVSAAKVQRLRPVLPDLACLFLNGREAAVLAGDGAPATVDALRRAGVARAVITNGPGPVVGFDQAGQFSMAPPAPRNVADVTGAGDALAGATSAALLIGKPLRAAVREGLAAALLTVESADAAPAFSETDFRAALDRVPEPQTKETNTP